MVREMIGNKIGRGALAVSGGRPHHRQGSDQFLRLPHLAAILSILNQLHDPQAQDCGQFRERGKPRQSWDILPLDVNQHVGIEEVHGLFPESSFRLVTYLPCMRLAIGDI